MKKVLLFHHFNSSLGAGLSFLHILRSIDREKYTPIVCLLDVDGDLDSKIKDLGIEVIKSGATVGYMHYNGSQNSFVSIRHLKNIISIRKSKNEIRKIIDDVIPDLVCVNSLTLFWIGKIAQEKDIRTIMFDRETFKHLYTSIRTRYMVYNIEKYFDKIACLSYYDIECFGNKNRSKFNRITDKVDLLSYSTLCKGLCRSEESLPDKEYLVLYVGGMAKLKGAHILLKSLKYIKSNVKIVILQYSDARIPYSVFGKLKYYIKRFLGLDYQNKCLGIIKKNKLEDMVIFKPSTDCVEKYFCACDAVVFPCTVAHQARPVFEAGVSNIPIIITDFPNYKEFVTCENGYLFKNRDYKDLAYKIDYVYSSDNRNIIEKNNKMVLANNDLRKMTSEITDLFESV